ncbi:unnamed protein product [Adineta steineri]|uniref:Uncharacterized protein n=1 Tax=Adineta steineri TaxID=433720 RepID=A0A819UJK1_9BILA|nr:unnamed protein product [Adineta steineri]CAF4096267.1 unnamed protein product [Adineta steineri]
MDSNKNGDSPPPYVYSTLQPTNSFASPFASNEPSKLNVELTNPTFNNNNASSSSCRDCLECFVSIMEFLTCCCAFVGCIAECAK